jgi:hypothetical protein
VCVCVHAPDYQQECVRAFVSVSVPSLSVCAHLCLCLSLSMCVVACMREIWVGVCVSVYVCLCLCLLCLRAFMGFCDFIHECAGVSGYGCLSLLEPRILEPTERYREPLCVRVCLRTCVYVFGFV